MAVLLSCAAGTPRRCRNCGSNPVPYPLSTGPDCGHPMYSMKCTKGKLWFDDLSGSSYMIKSINPVTRRIIIRPASISPWTCVSGDFRNEGIQLNKALPFKMTGDNTVFLYNCTNAMPRSKPPLDCSPNDLCHSYIKDHADGGGACKNAGLCCSFRTVKPFSEYMIRVHEGDCAAYQSFVNLNVAVAPPPNRWPELGIELEWEIPVEPVCKGPKDCKELLNSKCLKDPTNARRMKCLCNAGFKWDPSNGLCKPCKPGHGEKKKATPLAGSLGAIVFIALVVSIFLYKKYDKSKKQAERKLTKQKERILNAKANCGLSARIFTMREIKKATNNFSKDNLISTGGFGEVFKGTFDDGTVVAIKRAKLGNTKALDQILNEVRILCQVNHRNLVRLLGCCVELDYQPLQGRFDHLHTHRFDPPLQWLHRLKVAHQTAQALYYLHSSALPPIYHRDVKSSNILLDDKLDAKVSDFGLSRLVEIAEANKSHIFTSAQGTLGYLDPEYYRNFQLTDKSDVYSFGVVLLEILTREKAIDFNREEENVNLVVYGKKMIKEERFLDMVDPVLTDGATNLELETMKSLGFLAVACLDEQRHNRPPMKEVSDEIEYLISILTSDVPKT
ncbi:wall-associated receptor kinase-like 20 [Neltuma alba]|uniref:wall-associated receptor kinase-like 20 n=1 Tax=Neltuma alba TaxID=207710 RepID=UPI0010A45426|nr:wall-associated receptor kinase-like 20 [Prosopis alba]